MTLSSSAFAVTDTPQKIYNASPVGRATIEIVNLRSNTADVEVGGADLELGEGRPIEPGERWAIDTSGEDDIWIVAASATTVRLLILS